MTREERQFLIGQDRLADGIALSRVPVPSPRPPAADYAPGVQVLMSTHRRPALLKECLASIEAGMAGTGVRWNLIVFSDGEDPETDAVLRAHASAATSYLHGWFTKARSVAEAKNRVALVAKSMEDQFPWLLWMDDDDLFKRARVTELLPQAIRYGHRIAAGKWSHWSGLNERLMSPVSAVRPPWYTVPPQATVIHCSLIPADGRFFDESLQVWEDLSTWNRLLNEGVEIAALPTPGLVAVVRETGVVSASRPEPSMELNSVVYAGTRRIIDSRRRKPSRTASFCTVCIGSAVLPEMELWAESVFRFSEPCPVHIWCDPGSAAFIQGLFRWRSHPLVLHPLAGPEWIAREKARFKSITAHEQRFPSAVMAAKMHVMEAAIVQHGETFYMDSDCVLVGDMMWDRYEDSAAAQLAYHQRCLTFQASTYGFWQAGMVRSRSLDFVRDWRETSYDDSSFQEQLCLMRVVTRHRVSRLPAGHNVGIWSWGDDTHEQGPGLLRGAGPERTEAYCAAKGLSTGAGNLWWRGTRLRTVHAHCRPEISSRGLTYNDDTRRVLVHLLSQSEDLRHKELLRWISPR